MSLVRTRSVEAFKEEPLNLEARIIAAIGKVGPRNVAAISRITGAHQETIRYKMKKRFAKLGFRFHAEVDYDKLGLSLHWVTLHFSPKYYNSATNLLRALNKVGYLTYYAKIIPQGHYVALLALPIGTTSRYRKFLNRLQQNGILSGFNLQQVLANRHAQMDPRFFNFHSGKWEIEWGRLKTTTSSFPPPRKETRTPVVDRYDLLIIKELQKDATQHVIDIARNLGVHEKTLEYHFRAHVLKHKLIRSYYVRWTQDIEKTLAHSVAATRLTLHGLDPHLVRVAQDLIGRIPFLWTEEMLNDGTYVAILQIPLEEMITTLAYINNTLSDLGSKVEIGFVKPREASTFTIPYELYRDGKWTFDASAIESSSFKSVLAGVEKIGTGFQRLILPT